MYTEQNTEGPPRVKRTLNNLAMGSRLRGIMRACTVLLALGGVAQTANADIEANKVMARRVFEEIWNQGDLGVADELLASDLVRHDSGNPSLSGPVGREGFKQLVMAYRAAFPDIHWTVHDVIAERDLVAARWTSTGTHQAELMGIPATGLSLTGTGISIVRIVDGEVQEEWADWDSLGMMQQLGLVPPTRGTYTWGEPSAVTGDPGDPDTNRATVQRMIDEVMNQGNLAVIDELFADDYLMHDPAWPMEVNGPEGFKQWAGAMLEPYFSDAQVAAEMIAEDDRVVVRWTWMGLHTGEAMGIPATGRRITVTGISIHRFADGKFVESWASYDGLGMMQQLTAEEWPQEASGPEGLMFVDIPGGTYEMGDHFGDGSGYERPVHTVTVSSFRLSKYEVTNAQYAEYLNSAMAYGLIKVDDGMVYASSDEVNLHYLQTSDAAFISQISFADGRFTVQDRSGFSMADHPVVGITWYGAKAFCDYYGYRLPTEAEWEYAARGGYHTPYFKYPWGSNSADWSQLNCCFRDPLSLGRNPLTTPVDYCPAYGYGLCGMAGNVSEWCSDWWDPYYYDDSPQQDPQGPAGGSSHSLRGGNWGFATADCRVTGRAPRGPDWYCPRGAVGFRCALDTPSELFRKHAEPGLMAQWKLDESEGAIAQDSVGDHDATVTGDATWRPDGGVAGGALEFDGIDDSVLTNLVLDPEDRPFSILAWIKGGAPGQVIASQAYAYVGRRKDFYPGCSWLAIDPALGTLTTEFVSPDSAASESDVVISDGQWHRVALAWDQSSKICSLYVDGVQIAAHVEPALPQIYGGLQIGTGKDRAPDTYWSGLIDDVRIYNWAVKP